jgi:Ca2+-binding EF-hand superfamily protein
VNNYWDIYDTDRSGQLDKDEARRFVAETLGLIGGSDDFSNDAFEQIFNNFDQDGSGTIEKDEMVGFLRSILNG